MSPIPFNRFPGIDENNRFAAVVRQAIATSAELVAAFASKTIETNVTSHIADKNNPHAVTKTQLGLSNVDNVSVLNDYIPKWKPNTNYKAGFAVISPFGEIVKSKTWHTSGTSFTATNWASVTNGDRVVVRGNYVLNPNAVGAAAGFAAYTTGTGETGTTTFVAAAVDGPTPDITTYARWTETATKTSGSVGWRAEAAAYYAPSSGASGETRTLDIWMRYTAPGGGSLNVTPRVSFYNGSTLVTTGAAGQTVLLQSGIWTKLSASAVATAAFTNVGWWVYSTTGANMAVNSTLDATAATVSTYNDDPMSGATSNANGYEYAFSGAANNSASYQYAVSNTSFVPRWKAGRAYTAGDQVVTPTNAVGTARSNHTASASFSTDAGKWDLPSGDSMMTFAAGPFAWSANASWDAGALSVDTSAEAVSQRTPGAAFAAPGSLSGCIKFLEPGIYDIIWDNLPSTEPGNAGYRINTSGTWPGPIDSRWGVLGAGIKMNGQTYWETRTEAIGIRVPQANLEVRLVGVQINASTNNARVKVIKRGSI